MYLRKSALVGRRCRASLENRHRCLRYQYHQGQRGNKKQSEAHNNLVDQHLHQTMRHAQQHIGPCRHQRDAVTRVGQRMKELLRRIVQPVTIAFSTTSSEAVMPKLMEELERFGCKPKVVSFVLPLGYSFNLDGSMMYMTFASLFIAQVYGVDMPIGAQLTMLLTLMLTSKGIAGVPRASLVVVAATLGMFGIPIEGIALILPIDHFCDMGRSATNVVGNAIATSVVSKWEGELGH